MFGWHENCHIFLDASDSLTKSCEGWISNFLYAASEWGIAVIGHNWVFMQASGYCVVFLIDFLVEMLTLRCNDRFVLSCTHLGGEWFARAGWSRVWYDIRWENRRIFGCVCSGGWDWKSWHNDWIFSSARSTLNGVNTWAQEIISLWQLWHVFWIEVLWEVPNLNIVNRGEIQMLQLIKAVLH